MLRSRLVVLFPVLLALGSGCAMKGSPRFGADVAFLRKHTDVVLLSDTDAKAQVAVTPQLQGRAMTSTAGGACGTSYGWLNRPHIASGELVPHINVYGGEDRFWIGPEGGQFSVFFGKDDPFDLEHWQTPAPFDSEPFELISSNSTTAVMRKDMELINYSGTEFTVRVDRTVRLLDRGRALKNLRVEAADGVSLVAYETDNRITNVGKEAWSKETGLLSVWILGMFKPTPSTTVVIPFEKGSEAKRGPTVNDTYFGKVPAERLVVGDGVLYFSGDGRYRSKIGLSPRRAKSVMGSYDAANGILTIVQYNKSARLTDYVNSMWELQDEPFGGDAINSYNDGPPEPGAKPLGPFYELETSSAAEELAPGKSTRHLHRTYHIEGPESALDAVAQRTLGVGIEQIKNAFNTQP